MVEVFLKCGNNNTILVTNCNFWINNLNSNLYKIHILTPSTFVDFYKKKFSSISILPDLDFPNSEEEDLIIKKLKVQQGVAKSTLSCFRYCSSDFFWVMDMDTQITHPRLTTNEILKLVEEEFLSKKLYAISLDYWRTSNIPDWYHWSLGIHLQMNNVEYLLNGFKLLEDSDFNSVKFLLNLDAIYDLVRKKNNDNKIISFGISDLTLNHYGYGIDYFGNDKKTSTIHFNRIVNYPNNDYFFIKK